MELAPTRSTLVPDRITPLGNRGDRNDFGVVPPTRSGTPTLYPHSLSYHAHLETSLLCLFKDYPLKLSYVLSILTESTFDFTPVTGV